MMNLSSPPHNDDEETLTREQRDKRWIRLTIIQYTSMILIMGSFVGILGYGIVSKPLDTTEAARGLITFVVAVTTVSIALIMAFGAIMMGKDFEKRFALGKEILTLMIGILGTIIGFYYGASQKSEPPPTIRVADVVLTPPQPKVDDEVTIKTKLMGGTSPYTYRISFTPATIPPIDGKSENGEISQTFKAAVAAGTPLVIQIEGVDSNGVAFAYNKDRAKKVSIE